MQNLSTIGDVIKKEEKNGNKLEKLDENYCIPKKQVTNELKKTKQETRN